MSIDLRPISRFSVGHPPVEQDSHDSRHVSLGRLVLTENDEICFWTHSASFLKAKLWLKQVDVLATSTLIEIAKQTTPQ